MKISHQFQKSSLAVVLLSGIIATAFTFFNPYPNILTGWLSAFFLAVLLLGPLTYFWWKLSPGTASGSATLTALLTRLVIGFFLFLALPIWGHDEPYANGGYLYLDAYRRDSDAWTLAQSDVPLSAAFQNTYATDQYGGLLALSAGVYRVFSPEAHRPLLIVLFGAAFYAAGVPFLWEAVRKRWGENTAHWAIWIYALYPESMLLGACQMREPLLIGLSAIPFWAVVTWKEKPLARSLLAVFTLMLACLFSLSAGVLLSAAFALFLFFEHFFQPLAKRKKLVSIVIIFGLCLAGMALGWGLLTDYASYDIYLMETASGRVAYELENIGGSFRAPFLITYGLAQPVLPASIAYPGIPLARAIAIFRSLGWYLLIPFLLYSLFTLGPQEKKRDRVSTMVLVVLSFSWILLSSARAGGDQWDNPRYRAIFLVWQVVLAAWALTQYKIRKSPWLGRIILVETVFIVFFLQWYVSRYYELFGRLFFWQMVAAILIISVLVLGGGWFMDHIKQRRIKA